MELPRTRSALWRLYDRGVAQALCLSDRTAVRQYRTNGREIGDEAAFQTFLHDYKATVFPGRSPRQLVVWCYRPAERPLLQEQWDALDAPIANCHIYNVPQPVKILYDDLRHERIVCYVPPTLHIH